MGGRLVEVAHRPELASALTGLKLTDEVTEEALGKILMHAQGGLKGIPDSARVVVFLNKVESQSELVIARKVAKSALPGSNALRFKRAAKFRTASDSLLQRLLRSPIRTTGLLTLPSTETISSTCRRRAAGELEAK